MLLRLSAIVGGIVIMAAMGAAARGDEPIPDELLDRVGQQGHVAVVVELRVPWPGDEASIRVVQDGLLSKLARSPFRLNRRYATIPFIALDLSAAALRLVAASPLVVGITEDVVLGPGQPRSPPAVGSSR